MQTLAPETATHSASSLMQLITGNFVTQAVYVAAKLGIADLLVEGPQTVSLLANTTECNEDFLYRVLRTLSSLGLFEETANKTFQLNPTAHLLRSDVPESMRWMAIMMGEEHYVAWGHLKDSVQTGVLAFESVFGMDVFSYFKKNPAASEVFNNAMTGLAQNMYTSVVSSYDFSGFNTLVDIGGGHGMLLCQILAKNPALQGVLFDLEHVVQGASTLLNQHSMTDRCKLDHGDFFQAVTPGADGYILSHIVHDWDDERAATLLSCIRKAMTYDGRVLVVEDVIGAPNTGPSGKLMDLNMLVMTPGGRERTESEFHALFERAGLKLNRIIPTQSSVCILEGVKA
jgi:hypothetical protein